MTQIGKTAKAFAPASVANVAVGFDVLGFSASAAGGDTVLVEILKEKTVIIEPASGLDLKLPKDPKLNTASAGLLQLIVDHKLNHGFRVSIQKGIPLGSGLGGSAASAVAATFAASSLLEKPLAKEAMLKYALIGETVASGSRHADNIAPSLYGGLTLSIVEENEITVVELPVPQDLWCVVIHPHIMIETKFARGLLTPEIPFQRHISQSAHLAAFMSGLFQSDMALLAWGLKDIVVEPQRKHLIPGFEAIQKAALGAGAVGCSISGAGPSMFAWAEGQSRAIEIESQMKAAARFTPCSAWAFALKNDGARLLAL